MASSMPSLIPPPTVINNEHRVYSVAVGLGVMCGVTTIVGVARLAARWRNRAMGLDDYVFVPSLVFYIAWSTLAIYVNIHAGVGKPLWEITLGEYAVWFQGILASAWLYPIMTFLIRCSILLFYRRIFSQQTSLAFRRILQGLLLLQVVYLVVYCILPAFICNPLHKAWSPMERAVYCDDWYYYKTQVALFSTSMAFDAFLLFLPVGPIWKLKISLSQRLGIIVIMMMGAAACIATAYKLAIFVMQMKRYTDIDPIWLSYQMSRIIPPQFDEYGTTFWIPSQVEPSVALIGASLPALRAAVSPPSGSTSKRFSSTWKSFSFGSWRSKDTSRNTQESNYVSRPDRYSNQVNPSATDVYDAERQALRGDYLQLQHLDRSSGSNDIARQ